MKLVKESLDDVLKPKQIIGNYYYVSNRFVSWPVFVIKIINVGPGELEGNAITEFTCEVVYNERMNEGPNFYSLDKGETVILDEEDLIYYEFNELDDEVPAVLDQEMEKLKLKKDYFQKLIDES